MAGKFPFQQGKHLPEPSLRLARDTERKQMKRRKEKTGIMRELKEWRIMHVWLTLTAETMSAGQNAYI